MQKSEIIRFLVLRTIGNFLVLFSLFGVFATFGPALFYEAKFRISQARGIRYIVVEPKKTSISSSSWGEPQGGSTPGSSDSGQARMTDSTFPENSSEKILTPPDTDFSILIPKIGASEKVFPNIDPIKEEEFLPILQKGVAHAKGTVFPGLPGNTYLFAHSADNFWNVGRYNAAFYLIKDLKIGDDIVIFFEDKRFNYKVTDNKIVDDSDVSDLIKSHRSNDQQLILQTCWPPGTTWKRLVITARPKI